MQERSEKLTTRVSRPAQVAVGLLIASIAALTALILWVNARDWLLVPSSRELSPTAALCVAGGCSLFIWFFSTIAYRLILNRPNREGGLFSSRFLYGAALIIALATLTLIFAPGRRIDQRARAFLYGTPMSAACWLLARRRATAARST
jgi:hypothetical protein